MDCVRTPSYKEHSKVTELLAVAEEGLAEVKDPGAAMVLTSLLEAMERIVDIIGYTA